MSPLTHLWTGVNWDEMSRTEQIILVQGKLGHTTNRVETDHGLTDLVAVDEGGEVLDLDVDDDDYDGGGVRR